MLKIPNQLIRDFFCPNDSMNKEILKLAIPNVLSNLSIPLVSLVDVSLMGHLSSSSYIIAIGMGVMIFNFIYWSFGFLRMGTTGMISQAYGANDFERTIQVLKQSLIIGFVGAVLLLFSQSYILQLSNFLIDSNSNIRGLIHEYFSIRIWAAPATILTYVFTGWFLGMQNSKSVLYLTLIVNFGNALLSYLFVFVFDMDIRGVAWGTLIAQYAGLAFCLLYFKSIYIEYFKFSLKRGNSILFGINKLLFLNGNIFIRTFLLIFVLSVFKVVAGNIDSQIGAANILLLEFVTISAYGIDGFAFAAEALCGKYFGTNKIELFKKAVKTSFVWGLCCGLLFSVLFYFFGSFILSILTDKIKIIDLAIVYLPWLVLAPFVNSIAFIWDGVFIGATASKLMRNSMVISAITYFVVYKPLENFYGNNGLWLGLTIFMLSRGILQSILYKKIILNRIS
jgi:MATE family multidrug resistance protein